MMGDRDDKSNVSSITNNECMHLNVCECMNDTDHNFNIIINNANNKCDMYKYLLIITK